MSENTLVVGATSGIARALCRVLAARGCSLILAGRSPEGLEELAESLAVGAQGSVHTEVLEALDFAGHATFLERCIKHFDGKLDGVVICIGYLADQPRAEVEFEEIRHTVDVNFTSVAAIASLAANHLERRRQGYIAAISSVTGDRGRQSSYTYGAAKAALNTFLQGLRNRLAHRGVHVLTIKPGWVATRMTAGVVDPTSPMVASPDKVARQIDRGIRRRRNVIYTPGIWRLVMSVVRLIPEPIFKRLRL